MMIGFKHSRAEIDHDYFGIEKTTRFGIAGGRLDEGPLAFEEDVFGLEF